MTMFNVTFEIITPASAEDGEAADRGFIIEGASLRDAFDAVLDLDGGANLVEASEHPVTCPRWVTAYGSPDFYSGDCENRSIHFPESLTAATRVRIARLMGCYGVPAL